MFGFQKVPRKEKKYIKENDFCMFGCLMKNTKKKNSNIIKISKKLTHLQII